MQVEVPEVIIGKSTPYRSESKSREFAHKLIEVTNDSVLVFEHL